MKIHNLFAKKSRRITIIFGILLIVVLLVVNNQFIGNAGNMLVKYKGQRIAISMGGNAHDKEDWGSAPMILVMLQKKGCADKLVHFDYNSYLWENEDEWDTEMAKSVQGAIRRFNYCDDVFYNNRTSNEIAVKNLAKEIEKSSKDNPLYFILGGPPEVLYEACKRATRGQEFVYVITNTKGNDNNQFSEHPNDCHDLRDISGINIVKFSVSKNKMKSVESDGRWNFLKNATDDRLRFLYDRMVVEEKADVTDALMVYMLIENDQKVTIPKIENLINHN